MENRKQVIQKPKRCASGQQIKFKPLPASQFNELNTKYQIYSGNKLNSYTSDMDLLKIKNIKSNTQEIGLAGVDLSLFRLQKQQPSINNRDYQIYPNLMMNALKGRFKQQLSQKRQIKDFIIWFENEWKKIIESKDEISQKFKNKQTLLAAGFGQMIGQVITVSKNRGQIIKMLWNRQNQQISQLLSQLNGNSIKKQRDLLSQINTTHKQYQRQLQEWKGKFETIEESQKKEKTKQKGQLLPLKDIQDEKNSLYQYFRHRIRAHPEQKILIHNQFLSEDIPDNTQKLQEYFKQIINKPSIKNSILDQSNVKLKLPKSIGINTMQQQPKIFQQKQIQVQLILVKQKQFSHIQIQSSQTFKNIFNITHKNSLISDFSKLHSQKQNNFDSFDIQQSQQFIKRGQKKKKTLKKRQQSYKTFNINQQAHSLAQSSKKSQKSLNKKLKR